LLYSPSISNRTIINFPMPLMFVGLRFASSDQGGRVATAVIAYESDLNLPPEITLFYLLTSMHFIHI
jgi:hypothetical protein